MTPIRTLRELVDVVQELIDSTGKHVYAEDLQEALDRVETVDDWQPIETAPKDGRWIWVKREPPISNRLAASAFVWDDSHGMWFGGTGWWHQFPMGWTHWMPLGEPPDGSAAAKRRSGRG
jgi:hypothetical protein